MPVPPVQGPILLHLIGEGFPSIVEKAYIQVLESGLSLPLLSVGSEQIHRLSALHEEFIIRDPLDGVDHVRGGGLDHGVGGLLEVVQLDLLLVLFVNREEPDVILHVRYRSHIYIL